MGVNGTSSPKIVWLSLGVYAPLAVLGAGWAFWSHEGGLFEHPAPWWTGPPLTRHAASGGLGVALAIITIFLSQRWVRAFAWAAELHLSFREILGGLSPGAVLVLALASGIGEELFFRAAMQPSLGWVITSLIFGVVHLGPDRRFLPWTAWALAMGFLLGAIYEATGSMIGPILAHVTINAVNLSFIVRHDPRGPSPTAAPRVVGRSERR